MAESTGYTAKEMGGFAVVDTQVRTYEVLEVLSNPRLPEPPGRFTAQPYGDTFLNVGGIGPALTRKDLADMIAANQIREVVKEKPPVKKPA